MDWTLTKELLGIVRSKYGFIPMVTVKQFRRRHFEVRMATKKKKFLLVTQLREILEQTSRKTTYGNSRQR